MLAASIVVGSEGQVAVMAPTEILAEQHYHSFKEWCDQVKIVCTLLTGSKSKKDREPIYSGLKSGSIQLVVGTHALIQENVGFKNLGMIIVDEQHRFGVDHRKRLIEKGLNPQVLAMTATPIPRTLAFTIHGDMEISIIDELPKSRIPIITKVVEPSRMDRVYDFIRKEMVAGRQCFVVYPLIEESEKMDLKAAETGFEQLRDGEFSSFKLGHIHGRMKKEERDAQMEAMAQNEIQCLTNLDHPNIIKLVGTPHSNVPATEYTSSIGSSSNNMENKQPRNRHLTPDSSTHSKHPLILSLIHI